jgi:hypothetical protein
MTVPPSTLSPSTNRHKVISTWTYTAAELQRTRPTQSRGRHEVTVALVAPSAQQPIQFEAACVSLGVTLTDTDINQLHGRMQRALDAVVAIRDGASWEPWLEVRVGAGHALRSGPTTARQLELSYRPLLRGTHPDHPGEAFTVTEQGHVAAFPQPLLPDALNAQNEALFARRQPANSAAELTAQLNQYDRRTPNMTYVYLPDTPVNRESLDRILSAMDDLTDRLHTLLHPDQAAQSLADLSLGRLLGHTS